jgi:hypothetical protein
VGETVVFEGLDRKLYDDETFEVVDAKLRLVNVDIYGWEVNVWGGNTLIVRDSNFSGATLNGGDSVEVIENSVLDLVRGHEQVEITVRSSVIKGDVIATQDSVITLIDSVVERDGDEGGDVFAVDNGRVVLINTEVQGEQHIEDNGVITIGAASADSSSTPETE